MIVNFYDDLVHTMVTRLRVNTNYLLDVINKEDIQTQTTADDFERSLVAHFNEVIKFLEEQFAVSPFVDYKQLTITVSDNYSFLEKCKVKAREKDWEFLANSELALFKIRIKLIKLIEQDKKDVIAKETLSEKIRESNYILNELITFLNYFNKIICPGLNDIEPAQDIFKDFLIYIETINNEIDLNNNVEQSTHQTAQRKYRCPDIAQIPYVALMACAEAFTEGELNPKYGLHNWKKGQQDFAWRRDSINHAIKHLYLHIMGDRSENHLGKVMFAASTEAYFESLGNIMDLGAGEILQNTRPKNEADLFDYKDPNAVPKEFGELINKPISQ